MTLQARSRPANLSPLLPIAIAFVIGILINSAVDIDVRALALLAAAACVTAFFARDNLFGSFAVLVGFLTVGWLCAHAETISMRDDRLRVLIDNGIVESGTPVEIEGELTAPVEPTKDGGIVTIAARSITFHGQTHAVSGTVRAYYFLANEAALTEFDSLRLAYGSKVAVAGELLREESYQNPGVPSRKAMLDRQGIDATVNVKSPLLIQKLGEASVFVPLKLVYYLRARLIERFETRFSASTGGVLTASMLGNKYFLDKPTADVFREGGTFHILVISGMHITFIGVLLFAFVSAFTSRTVVVYSIVTAALWAYTLAVGADAPVVRASLMFTVLAFSRIIYRQRNLLNSFSFCVVILLVWRPSDIFSPSLQLTLVSVSAIVLIAFPLIEKLRQIGAWMPTAEYPFPPRVPGWLLRSCETIYWNPARWQIEQTRQIWSAGIRKSPFPARVTGTALQRAAAYIFEGVLVSLIVQLLLLPLSAIYFHRIVPGSIVMNLWAGMVLAAESFTALAAVCLGTVSDLLASPFYSLTEFLNFLLVTVPASLFSKQLLGWRIPSYSGWMGIVYGAYYLPLVGIIGSIWCWRPFCAGARQFQVGATGLRFDLKRIFAPLLFLAVLLTTVIAFHPLSTPRPDGRLHIDLLDVGQGDAALLTFPDGTTMLIDGGGRIEFPADDDGPLQTFVPDVPGIGEAVVSPFLWQRGYSHLDYVVATHADADHMQGLIDVASNFSVGQALFGREPRDDPEFISLETVLRQREVPIEVISRGKTFTIGGAVIEVLWPTPAASPEAPSDNDHSVVIRIVFGSRSILLTGDIEQSAEEQLAAGGGNLSADVIKVAHHGSRTSSTQGFIDRVGARYAVISVGRRSRFGHPHREVIDRWQMSGAEVMTTGKSGMISFSTDGRDLAVSTFR